MTPSEKIADLVQRIENLRAEASPLRKQLGNIDRQTSKLSAELAVLRAEEAKRNLAPKISDHAVLRYLERRYDFDFEGVRKELLSDKVKSAIRAGATGIKTHGGTLKISGNVVTTFIGGIE